MPQIACRSSGRRTTRPVMICESGCAYSVTEDSECFAPWNAPRLFQRWKKVQTLSGTTARREPRRARRKLPCAPAVVERVDMPRTRLGDGLGGWQAWSTGERTCSRPTCTRASRTRAGRSAKEAPKENGAAPGKEGSAAWARRNASGERFWETGGQEFSEI